MSVCTISTQYHPAVPAGGVISQSPSGGANVAPGTAVNLVISSGPLIITVTFDSNGGIAASPLTIQVSGGVACGTLATTSRIGYDFVGWFTAATGGSQMTSDTIVSNAVNHTLYAKWAADTNPPTAVSLSPVDDETAASTSGNLVITFNEPVAFNTGNITLKKSATGSVVESFNVANPPANLSVNGAIVTINPTTDLENLTGYCVQIDATAVKDLAGNAYAGIANTTTWNFTAFNPSLVLLLDNFNTADTTTLDTNLATRQSGTMATSGYTKSGTASITSTKLSTGSASTVFNNDDFKSALTAAGLLNFTVSFDLANTGTDWVSPYLSTHAGTDDRAGSRFGMILWKNGNSTAITAYGNSGTGQSSNTLSKATLEGLLGYTFNANVSNSFTFVATPTSTTAGTYDLLVNGVEVLSNIPYLLGSGGSNAQINWENRNITNGVASFDNLMICRTLNSAPTWISNPITGTNANLNATYSGTLAGTATDANGHTLTYAKVSGPAWLTVAANGALSGIPGSSNAGTNSFTVSVSDGRSTAVQATLNITVQVQTAFAAWANGSTTFIGDANIDGIADGLAWLLGAATPSQNARALMPVGTHSGGNLSISFSCLNAAKRGSAVLRMSGERIWTAHSVEDFIWARHHTPSGIMNSPRQSQMKVRILLAISASIVSTFAQGIPKQAEKSELSTYFLSPTRIVWSSDKGVENAETLLNPAPGQSTLNNPQPPVALTAGEDSGAIVLDFGSEISGYLELFCPGGNKKNLPKVRIRFGESVAETMVNLGERGAQNDHAQRDQIVELPWLGKKIVGPSGFRFVRIDAVEGSPAAHFNHIRAVLQIRDIPYLGNFRSNDERLNKIWDVGAWTVHLNMQDYLWDGIKRDRLVWLGDMHPEVSVIGAVFGDNVVVPKSLDLIRDNTPATDWMNGISSYSLWWIILHEDWYNLHGNLDYLRQQRDYLKVLLPRTAALIDENGSEKLTGGRFLDWPTANDKKAVHEGLQAMMVLSMQSGARLMKLLDEPAIAETCTQAVGKLRSHIPEPSGRKSPAALNALAGLRDPAEVATALKKDGPDDLSTFYGFYVIEALGKAGETSAALDIIRRYWGGMLDVGATTFWEDFDLKWTENSGRIDELVPPGKKDIHGDFGAHCYIGFRHSFCHGWAGGPTAFLSHRVLGIQPAAPGFAKVRIAPDLGDLQWAEGSYPTPKGLIKVRHDRQPDRTIKSAITLPPGVERVE